MGNFFKGGFQQMPGVSSFQQQLQQLIGASQQPLSSGAYGPFASWAAQVGKWLNNPNKQAKNPFESGGGGLFTPWTAPITAAHGMNVRQITDAGQNPLIPGQYQPINQSITQNKLLQEGDQYGMNLRGGMQQALGTAMGEFGHVQDENQAGLMSLLGDYGGTLRDVVQTPSGFSQMNQLLSTLSGFIPGTHPASVNASDQAVSYGAPPGYGMPPSPTGADVGNPFGVGGGGAPNWTGFNF